MLQIGFLPDTFPNPKLEEELLSAADKYIKSGKLTMAGVMGYSDHPANLDYRLSAFSNRLPPIQQDNGTYQLGSWRPGLLQIVYRIFVDKRAALEFIKLNKECGARIARIITPEQRGVVFEVPADILFPPIEQIHQFLWKNNENIS
jgi:hypothetical protein